MPARVSRAAEGRPVRSATQRTITSTTKPARTKVSNRSWLTVRFSRTDRITGMSRITIGSDVVFHAKVRHSRTADLQFCASYGSRATDQ
ncbi:hypothetical protein Apa02nite_003980 [Actinoplanes palleronii]|uniref:Uncharacterized protein n=1 Tax=Actinoplanes palleronii TaxID=113570 RepID=A0ABQ4B0U7_9ACTN|nr:hypothetical protein Apa02nite_003980 [Actinoplanes palleronii]